jgi:hypothetical protein
MSLKDTESRIVVRRGRPRDLPDELMPHRDVARVEEVDDADHLRVRQRGELLFGVQAELRQRRQDGEPNLDAVRAPHAYGHLSSGPLEQHLMVHHAARGELPLGWSFARAAGCRALRDAAGRCRAVPRALRAGARARPATRSRLPRSGARSCSAPKRRQSSLFDGQRADLDADRFVGKSELALTQPSAQHAPRLPRGYTPSSAALESSNEYRGPQNWRPKCFSHSVVTSRSRGLLADRAPA